MEKQLIMEQRVKNGAKFLDENIPGWWNGVDISALNLSCFSKCVIGQLFEDFKLGLNYLGLEPFGNNLVYFGFDRMLTEDYKDYDKLTMLWKVEINSRLNKDNTNEHKRISKATLVPQK